MADRIGKPISQRQLRVGEMIKQSLSMIFIRNEAKVPNLETNTITVTEVRMSQDLKIAKAYVLPLGGKNAEEVMQRLCPIDVRLSAFKTGCVAKTMLGLMPVTLHRSGKDQFDIYTFRSMSRTLVSEITESIKKTMYLVKQK